jgi:hypothetical protein
MEQAIKSSYEAPGVLVVRVNMEGVICQDSGFSVRRFLSDTHNGNLGRSFIGFVKRFF